MRSLGLITSALLAATSFTSEALAAQPKNSVLLTKVQTLTLRSGLKTSHRRVSAIPQLNCVGGNAKGLYDVDVLRCKNAGSDYDDDNVQWTCTASLPEEFKLGSTDVICEGYDSPDDPYILKGSCGVEYRLILTDKGEQKYGRRKGGKQTKRPNDDGESGAGPDIAFFYVFWALFIGVVLWMLYSAFIKPREPDGVPRMAGTNYGGYGGGGNGGGDNGTDDPPPPYTQRPSYGTNPKPTKPTPRQSPRTNSSSQTNQSGRPGFWSGVLGGGAAGGAAGYYMGSRNRDRTYQDRYQDRYQDHRGPFGNSYGGGSSSWGNGEGSSGSSSSNSSTTRYQSTGFGSTSRR